MSRTIITGPSSDALAFFKNTPLGSLHFRQWQELFAACLGFNTLAAAISYEKSAGTCMDDMTRSAAVVLDPSQASTWLARKGIQATHQDLSLITRFLNEYWSRKCDPAPKFYWSIRDYLDVIEIKIAERTTAGLALIVQTSSVPELPSGPLRPVHSLLLQGKARCIDFPLATHETAGSPEAQIVTGKANVTFNWPRGLTLHSVRAAREPEQATDISPFSWDHFIASGTERGVKGGGLDYQQIFARPTLTAGYPIVTMTRGPVVQWEEAVPTPELRGVILDLALSYIGRRFDRVMLHFNGGLMPDHIQAHTRDGREIHWHPSRDRDQAAMLLNVPSEELAGTNWGDLLRDLVLVTVGPGILVPFYGHQSDLDARREQLEKRQET